MPGKDLDDALLQHLQQNARVTIAQLSRRLAVSRSTVTDRIERLEQRGIIRGYTVVLGEEATRRRVRAHIMVNVSTGQSSSLIRELRRMSSILRAYAVSGIYDLIVVAEADSTEDLDEVLDRVRELDGVESTLTSVVLSTKFER
ncbi:Lrp/AsnC family transcriptional regulator [Chromatocurvus halotolerans]|uniref:AsnC family transcriptional regulator n=1 Tax=Chromatocurvus halotolerans TaxID=1132028 RepID=A0A4R2L6T6_9GAMM|nr:Lrp/AsnC family transcriptional regulator [Chromatocurvus halotolerans]TCO78378.1 AsnC family transcriptional regulator [Chromatocurvus halotolerans]